MKALKGIISVVIIVLTVISCFAVTANATTGKNKISGSAPKEGGGSRTYFYATTRDTKKHALKMAMTKACIGTVYCFSENHKVYGYYEVIVWGSNNGRDYNYIGKTNVKNKASYNINLHGYRSYKISVYNWKVTTIAHYENWFRDRITGEDMSHTAYWESIPTWTVSKTSDITLSQ